jgi:hypothetical protein
VTAPVLLASLSLVALTGTFAYAVSLGPVHVLLWAVTAGLGMWLGRSSWSAP